ncbi:MAG: hypothetical protein L3J88_12335, partial [Gammaproteobacteria bacterium]|nr:hypothetical protein [Gammaproteobacteria bacterium]MCF6364102.1 hypothetical protein [Gammaproteobacteria bacterium]
SGWRSAELIGTGNGSARLPQIALNATGNALVVWQQSDDTGTKIWINHYVAGIGWGTAKLIETDNKGDTLRPQIAINDKGNALAVWYQDDGTRSNIWASYYVVGSGWGSAELIETDNKGNAYLPQIALDAGGNALAVWVQSDGTRNDIWANRYLAGSGWGSAELIETSMGSALSPQIALDAEGNALVVWPQSDGTRNDIWANRYVIGSGWGIAELIEKNGWYARTPQIALSAEGNGLAVWHQSDGTRASIFANRFE